MWLVGEWTLLGQNLDVLMRYPQESDGQLLQGMEKQNPAYGIVAVRNGAIVFNMVTCKCMALNGISGMRYRAIRPTIMITN